jgi:drug/metabolite transporter (DMT)-like permease
MPKEERNGILALLMAALLFAITTTLVRIASYSLSGYFVSMVRFAVGGAASLAWLFLSGRGVRVVNKKDWLLRGLYGAASMTLSYLAIARTSGGRSSMLSNTYPIFVAIFGRLFFGARLLPTAIPALLLCTVGSVVILNDGSGYSLLGDGFALLSAMLAGLAVNHLKRARATDDPVTLYLSPCAFGLPVAAAMAFASGGSLAPPTVGPVVLSVALGLIVFAAQILMTWGYKFVNAARGSRIFYLETVFAVALGAAIGERLEPAFFAGAAIIMGALWLDGSAQARRATAPVSGPTAQ